MADYSTIKRTKPTFRDIVAQERQPAIRRIWEKAKAASTLRHSLRSAGRFRDGQLLGFIKQKLVLRAVELSPDQFKVAIDSDFHIGLLSIRWLGSGSLHLPASTALRMCPSGPRQLVVAC